MAAGPSFPATVTAFEQMFATDADCATFLVNLRWPQGYACTRCGCTKTWMTSDRRLVCSKCRHKQSIVADTLMARTHYPLKTWFRVAWCVCEQKNGVSALGLQRAIGFGSYHTAWQWLHRMRRAMVLPGRNKLNGEVEVDETFIGGVKTGKRGRGAAGKALVLMAVEVRALKTTKRGRAVGRMLVVLGACAYGADAPTFHELVVAHYSFLPRNLNESAMDAKSKELDLFWSSVKSRGQSGLDDLRIELARTDTPVFFNYDGAKLLLSLSESSGDRSLALAAINRADIRDVQWNDFFLTVHFLAVSGLDTSDAAWKILWEDKFKVFIPQHSLTLDQEMCLLFLLLPTKESFYLEKAERRLFEEKSVVAQKSLLGLLANTATAQGDAALARFLTDASKPEEARNYAKTITETTKSMRSTTAAAVVGFSFKSYESLKEEQRKLFGRVSDEALGEWEILRLKIRRAMPRSKA